MATLTKQDLQEQLERAEDIIDQVATILADEDISDREKLGALEDLIFDDEDGD
jgi:hypothetical protein